MPLADFSLVFSDAEITDSFMVLRRGSAEDSYGRVTPTVVKIFPNTPGATDQPYGIITFSGPSSATQTSDQAHQQKTVSIATPFRLQGPKPGQLADIVRWHGDDYVVISVDDATGYGPGWVHSSAQRLDANVPLLVAPR